MARAHQGHEESRIRGEVPENPQALEDGVPESTGLRRLAGHGGGLEAVEEEHKEGGQLV